MTRFPPLTCDSCGAADVHVCQSARVACGGKARRRRYACGHCDARWTTLEFRVGATQRPGERAVQLTAEGLERALRVVRRGFCGP